MSQNYSLKHLESLWEIIHTFKSLVVIFEMNPKGRAWPRGLQIWPISTPLDYIVLFLYYSPHYGCSTHFLMGFVINELLNEFLNVN